MRPAEATSATIWGERTPRPKDVTRAKKGPCARSEDKLQESVGSASAIATDSGDPLKRDAFTQTDLSDDAPDTANQALPRSLSDPDRETRLLSH